MLNKLKHLYKDSSLTLRMTGSVNMYIITLYYLVTGTWIIVSHFSGSS